MANPATTTPSTPTAPADDQAARIRALKESATKTSEERDKATAAAAAAKGDLERAQERIADLEKQAAKLRADNAALGVTVKADGLPPLPELPKGAHQLLESVTNATGPEIEIDGKKQLRRFSANRGDVVFVDPQGKAVEKLQEKIGTLARVWQIDATCEADLRRMGALAS